jgi:hypothetical protein
LQQASCLAAAALSVRFQAPFKPCPPCPPFEAPPTPPARPPACPSAAAAAPPALASPPRRCPRPSKSFPTSKTGRRYFTSRTQTTGPPTPREPQTPSPGPYPPARVEQRRPRPRGGPGQWGGSRAPRALGGVRWRACAGRPGPKPGSGGPPPHSDTPPPNAQRRPPLPASYVATKMFVSNLNARLAQRFLALVLLPAVRRDIADNRRLHFALFQALRKATYKPGAFYKASTALGRRAAGAGWRPVRRAAAGGPPWAASAPLTRASPPPLPSPAAGPVTPAVRVPQLHPARGGHFHVRPAPQQPARAAQRCGAAAARAARILRHHQLLHPRAAGQEVRAAIQVRGFHPGGWGSVGWPDGRARARASRPQGRGRRCMGRPGRFVD